MQDFCFAFFVQLIFVFIFCTQETNTKKNFAHSYVTDLTKEAIFSDRKRSELMKIWPGLVVDMVLTALSDMADMESYMKRSLDALEKGYI